MATPDCPTLPPQAGGPPPLASVRPHRRRARLEVPDGNGGEAAMIWTLRPELGGMVERMIYGAYRQSMLPAEERGLARMPDVYHSVGAEYLAHAAATESDLQTRRVYRSALGLTETLADVPVHAIPCLRRRFDESDRVGLGFDHPRGLELLACPSVPWFGIGLNHNAFG